MRARNKSWCILRYDAYFARSERLILSKGGDETWGNGREDRDIVLSSRGVREDFGRTRERRRTHKENRGKRKLGFAFFGTSTSPHSTFIFPPFSSPFPIAGPSASVHQYARDICSEKVLLLLRGADSSVAVEPIAIVRVRTTRGAEVWERRSSPASKSLDRVSRKCMGEPMAKVI